MKSNEGEHLLQRFITVFQNVSLDKKQCWSLTESGRTLMTVLYERERCTMYLTRPTSSLRRRRILFCCLPCVVRLCWGFGSVQQQYTEIYLRFQQITEIMLHCFPASHITILRLHARQLEVVGFSEVVYAPPGGGSTPLNFG